MFTKILLFSLGFIIGFNFTKILRFIFLKYMSLKIKEKNYKNLFDNCNFDYWDVNEIKDSDFERSK